MPRDGTVPVTEYVFNWVLNVNLADESSVLPLPEYPSRSYGDDGPAPIVTLNKSRKMSEPNQSVPFVETVPPLAVESLRSVTIAVAEAGRVPANVINASA